MNTLVALVIALLVVGLLLWAVKALPFIDDGIKKVINIVVIVFVVLWLLSVLFGYNTVNFPALRVN